MNISPRARAARKSIDVLDGEEGAETPGCVVKARGKFGRIRTVENPCAASGRGERRGRGEVNPWDEVSIFSVAPASSI